MAKDITYRISQELADRLEEKAQALGVSPEGYACAGLIEKLEVGAFRGQLTELDAEVRKLRSDLALATQAILTVCGGQPTSAERATSWVNKNLNRD